MDINMEKKYTAEVVKVGDEHIMTLPMELLQEMGWKINDTLLWTVEPDGKITLSKVD
jgi:bifunctional DNA-binding transcriptional regulator/antitoxin component of YhaV-PrlF toxin-antitoxin module